MPARLIRVVVIAAVAAGGMVTAYGYQAAPPDRQWPPPVQKTPDESPALSPDDALKTFYLPPGYRLELVAAEPLIQDPIVINWDADGRLWAVEMPGFVPDLNAPEPNMDPIGRVVVLEDTNNDGRMDKRTVFADGLVLARALNVLDHGVLVGEPPYLWLMHDLDGDLRMDTKEQITDAYGRREARVEQNANGLYWSMDNWMHTANSDILVRFKNGKFEVQRTLSRGEWSATQDDAGRIYRNTNSSALHVDYVPTQYYTRNPNLLRTRGSYEGLDDEEVNVTWPVRPNPATNRSYQFGILRNDGTLAEFTSVCAPEVYRGDRLPAELQGNVFVAEPAANLVSRLVLAEDPTGLRISKAYERGEFIASTDERFRPVFISNAPDGTLYIVDMYRGIIQQRADITEYLRDQIIARKLEKPTGLGRIYRVMHETTRRDSPPALSKASPSQLVDTLSHPNGWRRDTAQRLLVERGDLSAAPALLKLAESGRDWRARAHALWTLDGLDAITPAAVVRALEDPSRDVRVAAVRIAERFATDDTNPAVRAALLKRLDDVDWNVQEQLAASLGVLPAEPRAAALATLLDRHADNPVVVDAALSGARGVERAILDRLLQMPAQTSQREIAMTMIAGTIVRAAQDTAVQNVFQAIATDGRPDWQRTAVLRGVEVALLGSTMPGTPPRRSGPGPLANAPCPTCPGGRAGPGGAYAFPQVPARGNTNTRRPLRLSREPETLSAFAAGGHPLAARAAAVLARVSWPGKPGAAAPIPPLTPEEQTRFEAGSEVYKNICVTCHQPDGQGQDKVAANLIGSALALAPAEVTARIVLNGKEGPIGLMPPVGSTLSDDQIAAVLTYIRREWGQNGTPVEPATVKDVRALTAARARPWTNEELLALIK